MRVKKICVVVQFCFWFNLDFPLFFSFPVYDNEYQTKENPSWTKNKIELQHMHHCSRVLSRRGQQADFHLLSGQKYLPVFAWKYKAYVATQWSCGCLLHIFSHLIKKLLRPCCLRVLYLLQYLFSNWILHHSLVHVLECKQSCCFSKSGHHVCWQEYINVARPCQVVNWNTLI